MVAAFVAAYDNDDDDDDDNDDDEDDDNDELRFQRQNHVRTWSTSNLQFCCCC